MKNVNLEIYNSIQEMYLYMNNMFFITNDNKLVYISTKSLFEKYLKGRNIKHNKLIKDIFFNNKNLNEQHSKINNLYINDLTDFWNKIHRSKLEIEIKESDFVTLLETPEQPILDFKIYGKRAYIANRGGVYEAFLNFELNKVDVIRKFERVFDSKSINLSPRMGEMLISTKSDGLFRGSLMNSTKLKLDLKSIISKSVKSSWTTFNFINYENDNELMYFKNDITDLNNQEIPNYLKYENIPYKINKFATRRYNPFESESNFLKESIIHSLNSLIYCFMITKDGDILRTKIDDQFLPKDRYYNNIFKVFKSLDIQSNLKGKGKPLSSHIIKNGLVLEYFNEIFQVKDGLISRIYNEPVLGLKSYPSSKKYKNIISLFTEDKISIQSTFPSLKSKSKKF